MLIISYGWTSAAFKAGRKTVTRRDWKPTHAAKFKKGTLAAAWDKDPRYGGQKIGIVRILEDVEYEAMADMPDSDYEAEGFAYLNDHPELVPDSMPIDISPEGFEAWRQSGGAKAVVRFEEVKLIKCPECDGSAVICVTLGGICEAIKGPGSEWCLNSCPKRKKMKQCPHCTDGQIAVKK